MVNYGRKLRMEADIRRKVKKATEFAERMKKVQKEAGAVLSKAQKEMKWQADKGRKKLKNGRRETR